MSGRYLAVLAPCSNVVYPIILHCIHYLNLHYRLDSRYLVHRVCTVTPRRIRVPAERIPPGKVAGLFKADPSLELKEPTRRRARRSN